ESLTDRIELEARALLEEVDALGGAARAIEAGFMQNRIAASAYELQKALEAEQVVVVGVNRFLSDEAPPSGENPDYAGLETRQRDRLAAARSRRDATAVRATLGDLDAAARETSALMPRIIAAVRARASLGEISDTLRGVWGTYQP
ncbi:MAG TPA: methylmalonyl-CoA mutase family protein, partial [Gemmatimonadales bacterium]|nr:methylmalonyl-CoA mutase family protein [Gemmatimonadales bacterium]